MNPSYGTSQSRVNFNRSLSGFSLYAGAGLAKLSIVSLTTVLSLRQLLHPSTPCIVNTAIGIAYGFKYLSIEFSHFAKPRNLAVKPTILFMAR